jgi:hypothetical protein
MEDIDHYNIPIYNFPFDIEEDDEETVEENSELRVCTISLFSYLTSLFLFTIIFILI